MKKKFLIGFTIVTLIAVAAMTTVNVYMSTQPQNLHSALTLRTIEAHAGLLESIKEWWDSKVYKCEKVECSAVCQTTTTVSGSISYGVGASVVPGNMSYGAGANSAVPGGMNYSAGANVSGSVSRQTSYCPGHKQACQKGNVVAHCYDCNRSCVPDSK
jgi:hypothetical protein